MEDRQIGIAIPTWQRSEMTIECFYDVYKDERVAEITIVDDASEMDIYEDLKSMTDALPKVKLFRNEINLDCYRNKHRSIELATSKWCCLWDSDNTFGVEYLNKLFEIKEWQDDTIYAPDFAMPTFDYQRYSGVEITRHNVANYMGEPIFQTCLNTMNFFINRDNYLKVWDGSVDPVTSDSIYFNFKWLEAGFKIKIVDGLNYLHRIHDKSHYNSNSHRTPTGFHENVLNKLRQST